MLDRVLLGAFVVLAPVALAAAAYAFMWGIAGLLLACLNIGRLGRQRAGGVYWLLVAAVQGTNGIWHVWASFKSRSYSPGAITGVLLYVPLAIYVYVAWVRAGLVPLDLALAAYAVGGGYHLWSAAYHRGAKDGRTAPAS